uniref:Uncharacterized protein n=1 Tax=Knipowitschia caucasica TaxID=637954 RepID=A0AAV2JTG9_KNICA
MRQMGAGRWWVVETQRDQLPEDQGLIGGAEPAGNFINIHLLPPTVRERTEQIKPCPTPMGTRNGEPGSDCCQRHVSYGDAPVHTRTARAKN